MRYKYAFIQTARQTTYLTIYMHADENLIKKIVSLAILFALCQWFRALELRKPRDSFIYKELFIKIHY